MTHSELDIRAPNQVIKAPRAMGSETLRHGNDVAPDAWVDVRGEKAKSLVRRQKNNRVRHRAGAAVHKEEVNFYRFICTGVSNAYLCILSHRIGHVRCVEIIDEHRAWPLVADFEGTGVRQTWIRG